MLEEISEDSFCLFILVFFKETADSDNCTGKDESVSFEERMRENGTRPSNKSVVIRWTHLPLATCSGDNMQRDELRMHWGISEMLCGSNIRSFDFVLSGRVCDPTDADAFARRLHDTLKMKHDVHVDGVKMPTSCGIHNPSASTVRCTRILHRFHVDLRIDTMRVRILQHLDELVVYLAVRAQNVVDVQIILVASRGPGAATGLLHQQGSRGHVPLRTRGGRWLRVCFWIPSLRLPQTI